MHLCAIAIHRHLGIAYPLRMRRGAQNRRHVICLLLPVWTVSAAVSTSLVVQGAVNRHSVLVPKYGDQGKMVCGIYDHTFAIYSSMLSFFVPLAVMVAVDVRSVQILRSARRRDVFSGSMSLSSSTANPSRDVSSPTCDRSSRIGNEMSQVVDETRDYDTFIADLRFFVPDLRQDIARLRRLIHDLRRLVSDLRQIIASLRRLIPRRLVVQRLVAGSSQLDHGRRANDDVTGTDAVIRRRCQLDRRSRRQDRISAPASRNAPGLHRSRTFHR